MPIVHKDLWNIRDKNHT